GPRDRTSAWRCVAPAPTSSRSAWADGYNTDRVRIIGAARQCDECESGPRSGFRRSSVEMSIVDNKKAYHDYFIEEKFEAGIALEGWEVKAIRAGRAQLKEAYVIVKGGEIVLIGAHVTPLSTASTHVHPDPTRTRKLLLHRDEISRLVGKVERAGYTMVPLNLHYSRGRVKLDIGLA